MPPPLSALARLVLYLHLGVIVFNLFWLVAIPLGAWRGWSFVRSFGWRALHLASLAVVALQAALGRLCFLTIWQEELTAAAGDTGKPSLIDELVTKAVFWPLPAWVFVVLYLAVLVYAALLWFLVPPRRSRLHHP